MNRIKNVFFTLAMIGFAITASAQSGQKFGHIDFPALIQAMPGQDSINRAYETYARGLENQLEMMRTEFENKQMEFEANQSTYSNLIRQTKERELQDIYNRLIEFNQQAQQDLVSYENQLLQPLIEKARKAIDAVAKENGYTYILNTTQGMVLYAAPSEDIMPRVKTKLGIK
jgi:outer membrane protein